MASQKLIPSTLRLRHFAFFKSLINLRKWWRHDVVGTVDQPSVIEKRREEAYTSGRYLFMVAMSGGIAILGLLLSSPAVVIGAMLLSPLMGPIMGLGFALAIGDYYWLQKSGIALAWGTLMAVALCSAVVFFSPLQDITSEIAARTRPNLFDLMVALFSALAGAYAMIRGREGTIVGVAIATALMPPLAVVGFGLATFNWTVFSGALLLYFTNLMTIALTAALMARIYGFRTRLSDRQTRLQNLVIIVAFVALAIPLAFSLRQIAWEANAARQVRGQLAKVFGPAARLSQPEIAFDQEHLTVSAFVWTTELKPNAELRSEESLGRILGEQVDIDLHQFLVRDEKSAEQAQLASAKLQEEAAANERVSDIGERLALAAGVSYDEVVVDSQRRKAYVRAAGLDDASLATYKALEQRIADSAPDWSIELRPPALPLPNIAFEADQPTDEGLRALNIVAWAAKRVDVPVTLTGGTPATRETAAGLLAEQDVEVQLARGGSEMSANWRAPTQIPARTPAQ